MKGRALGAATVVLACGAAYFLVVFAVGFLLGVVRTLWLAPGVGERWAELTEIPVMLAVIYLAARWLSRRLSLAAHGRAVQAGVGILGLILLLLGVELGFVLQLRGLSLAQYIEGRDPVSGTAYALSLLLLAAMPVLVSGRK